MFLFYTALLHLNCSTTIISTTTILLIISVALLILLYYCIVSSVSGSQFVQVKANAPHQCVCWPGGRWCHSEAPTSCICGNSFPGFCTTWTSEGPAWLAAQWKRCSSPTWLQRKYMINIHMCCTDTHTKRISPSSRSCWLHLFSFVPHSRFQTQPSYNRLWQNYV